MILRWPSRTRACVWGACLLAMAAGEANAQTLRGRMTDEATGAPIAGAFVELRDAGGNRITAVISDSAGRFQVKATRGGEFTVRIERIGYRTFESTSFALAGDSTVVRLFNVPTQAIVLPALEATSTRRCNTPRDLAAAVAPIWEEVRKALSVAQWTEASGQVKYEVRQYRKILDPALRARSDSTADIVMLANAGSPFRSVPLRTLLDNGFIQRSFQSWDYYGPDASVLLDDEFLDTHCFRPATHKTDRSLIGLFFEPAARPEQEKGAQKKDFADITGTLWIDRNSYELRFVEFRYTWLPWKVSTERTGGQVDFEFLPDGRVIVGKWWLRAPMVAPVSVSLTSRRDSIVWYDEIGNEVLRAFSADDSPITLRRR